MKYIDADKLIAEIERLNSLVPYENNDRHDEGLHDAYKAVKNVINSLQQEQPEVDLKKEIETYFKGWYMDETDQGYILHTPDDHAGLMSVKQVARHFYELGLNARKEEKK